MLNEREKLEMFILLTDIQTKMLDKANRHRTHKIKFEKRNSYKCNKIKKAQDSQ
jgi:hypothetical protein